ncbi:calcium-dependent protein kinase, putative [Perkinsus marinus ATCC 50983]|uniref:non-specific serine/threonine protein kinase n=1 Tax=Perkinsus marinus (strain ATCC 50983 / TXsc) TaxID=423536 RepID=C5LL37_PERM5|nr:calcium-dependent protein kinase, putative [Perkinsus marinus ATCC 50983]EER02601.1 calcium-dependent protein kinase, putative [Perkinsus marinus ATCC 50983]|eukprot:XP_002769883.1 calcium-dependent protein kinase, putative [Perkinsus marinus ATCC 50983]
MKISFRDKLMNDGYQHLNHQREEDSSGGSTRTGRDQCRYGCGRPCAEGFTASLERYDVCCWDCAAADEPLGIETIPEEGGMNERQLRRLVHRAFHVLRNDSAGGVRKIYNFLETVGRGSFGVVHKVVHKESDQLRVCKSVDKAKSSVPLAQLEEEIKIISQLDHPNVIKIYEYFEDPKYIHLIMEACWGGELLSVIQTAVNKGVSLPDSFIADVTREVLTALSFMHNQGVVHKDLKPENILFVDVSEPSNVKVIDFGLAELFGVNVEKSMNVAGTAFYMAPEIFRPPFDYKCDIWSLGVILYLLLTGYLPFFGTSVSDVKSNVIKDTVEVQ